MKIKPEHYAVLKAAIEPLDKEEHRRAYRAGDFPRSASTKDVNMRYRWDLLYASKLKIGDSVGMRGDLPLYDYMDDTHIDTALRSIVPDLS